MSELSTDAIQSCIDFADNQDLPLDTFTPHTADEQLQALVDENKRLHREREEMIAEFKHNHRPFTRSDNEALCRECGYECLELRLVQGDKQ